MAKKSIKKNYIFNLVYQILLMIIPLITTPYLARVLGADGNGLYSYSASIVSYFTLFAAMGTASYGQREVSYVRDDKEKLSAVFWNTEILSLFSTTLCLIIYFIFIIFFADNKTIYIIQAISIISVAADITWLFQGLEDFQKIVIRNTIFRLIGVALIFILVRTKDDLDLYIFQICAVNLVSMLSLWPFLKNIVRKPKREEIHPFKQLPTVLSLFIPTIAISIYTVLDKTMIGAITKSSYENGYYEQAYKISKMALTVVTSLGTVMVPRIGYLFNQNDKKQIQQYMYRSYQFAWSLGIPICLGLVGISDNIVPWFFGPGYDKVSPLLKVLSFLVIAIGINNVTGVQYLIPTKRQNTFTLTVIIGALTNFTLNSILIRTNASVGAAIASVIAETTIAVVQIVIVRKELSPAVIIQRSWRYFLGGAVMLAVLRWENTLFSSSILHTLIMIISGVLVYMVMMVVERDNFLIGYVKQVMSKIIRK